MPLQVWIGGVDRTAWILPGSLEITEEMNARNTLRCLLRDPTGTIIIETGDELIIYRDDIPPSIISVVRTERVRVSDVVTASLSTYRLVVPTEPIRVADVVAADRTSTTEALAVTLMESVRVADARSGPGRRYWPLLTLTSGAGGTRIAERFDHLSVSRTVPAEGVRVSDSVLAEMTRIPVLEVLKVQDFLTARLTLLAVTVTESVKPAERSIPAGRRYWPLLLLSTPVGGAQVRAEVTEMGDRSVGRLETIKVTDTVQASMGTLLVRGGGGGRLSPRAGPPQVGPQIVDGERVRLFAGTVEEPESTLLLPGEIVDVAIAAVDFNQLADRILVAEVYENMTIAAITADVVSYLFADGVTLGTIRGDAVITRKVFNYVSVAEALNWVSEQTGYAWEIDYYRVFTLLGPDEIRAPFDVTATTVRSMTVRRPRGGYRNRQYIRGGHDLTDLRTEEFRGDGTRRTFTVAFPIGKEPAVTRNGVPQTVGIRGVETGFDWYWNLNSGEISQNAAEAGDPSIPSAQPVLGVGETIDVTYRGLFPILVQAQDEDEILARQIIEGGGSGLYEALEDHHDIDDAQLALDTAVAKLERDGLIRDYIDIETDEVGLHTGQLASVVEGKLQLAGTYLVQSVVAVDVSGTFLRYRATLMSGDAIGGWITFYQELMNNKRRSIETNQPEDEMLMLSRLFREPLLLSDEPLALLGGVKETRIGFGRIGSSEVGVMP